MANSLLQKRSSLNHGNPPTVGKLWVYNFTRLYRALESPFNQI